MRCIRYPGRRRHWLVRAAGVRHLARVNRWQRILAALASVWLSTQALLDAAAPVAANGFHVPPGFRVELVAAEPLVFDPVALAFDGDGRLFVAEQRDFPGPEPGSPPQGRVRLLQDTDGDGSFDISHDFAESLSSPSALICWDKGVLVAAGPQIVHCKDTDGDGRADERGVWLAAPTNTPVAVAGAGGIRSFVWGLDNRVYAAAGGRAFRFETESPNALLAVPFPDQDLALDPRTQTLQLESSYGSTGLGFDNRGRLLTCTDGWPLQQVLWSARHAAATNGHVLPGPMLPLIEPSVALSTVSHASVRPASGRPAGESSRALLTAGLVTPSSLAVYRGHTFPAAFSNAVFVADARAGTVWRFNLLETGVALRAVPPALDSGALFLSSTDSWFRPMHLAVGPDGALYVADMRRQFLDAPGDLPEALATAARERPGRDQGRIYRIVPDGFKQPAAPALERAPMLELLRNLAHRNGWHRDTAARLLCQRADPAAVPLLSNMLHNAQSPLARLHALALLDGLGALRESQVVRGLLDADDSVRLHAVRLAPLFFRADGSIPDSLWTALRPRATDALPAIRYELALTLGNGRHPQRNVALLEILRRDPDGPWTRAGVMQALASAPEDGFDLLLSDARFRDATSGRTFLAELALAVGTVAEPRALARTLAAIERLDDAALAFTLLANLDEGLRRAGSSLWQTNPSDSLKAAYQRAILAAGDTSLIEPVRAAAIPVLAGLPFDEVGELLFALVSPVVSERLQAAAVEALAAMDDPRVGRGLIQRWGGLPEGLRHRVLDVLVARPANALALLDALANGRIRPEALTAWHQAVLRGYPDAAVHRRAAEVLGPARTGESRAAVERIRPALALQGDPGVGRQVFLARCAGCHRFRGEGAFVGPNLEVATARGREWTLTHAADPNRTVPPRGLLRAVESRVHGHLLGCVEFESPAGLRLRLAGGQVVVLPRVGVRGVTELGISAMPESPAAGLSPQGMADVLAHLTRTGR